MISASQHTAPILSENFSRDFLKGKSYTPAFGGLGKRITPKQAPSQIKLESTPRRKLFDLYSREVSKLSMHLPDGFALALNRKTKALLSDDNWDEADVVPEDGAMLTLLRALLVMGANKLPSLGSNGNGSLSATWVSGRNQLTLDCADDDNLGFVLSRESEDGVLEHAAGITKLQRLTTILTPYTYEVWFK